MPRYAIRPDVNGVSPLASYTCQPRTDAPDRPMPVYGVALHCTGSGIVEKARKAKVDPLKYAVDYYLQPKSYYAHYVIGFDGTIACTADEHERAPHIGLTPEDAETYRSGAWEKRAPSRFVSLWKTRWASVVSPVHLFPKNPQGAYSPNSCYVGIELLVWLPGCPGAPLRPGMLYTRAQHEAAAELTKDIARRWGFRPEGSRVVCHEDVTPLTRTTKDGGWDPGVLRDSPSFDWSLYLTHLRQHFDT